MRLAWVKKSVKDMLCHWKTQIQCNHSFCKDCVTQYMIKCQESNKFPCCALCRGDFMDIKVNNVDVLEEFQHRFCV